MSVVFNVVLCKLKPSVCTFPSVPRVPWMVMGGGKSSCHTCSFLALLGSDGMHKSHTTDDVGDCDVGGCCKQAEDDR